MRARAVVVGAAALAALASALPASGAAGRAGTSGIALTVRATGAGVGAITLSRPTVVRTPFGTASPDVAITGRADAVLALRGEDPGNRNVGVMAVHLDGSGVARALLMAAPRYPIPPGTTGHFIADYGGQLSLPPGHYQLLAWSAGVSTFSIRLSGLPHNETVRLSRARAIVDGVHPTTLGLDNAAPGVFATAATHSVPAGALLMQFLDLHTTAFAGGQYFLCHYNGPAPILGLDTGPTCPTADGTDFNDRDVEAAPAEELYLEVLNGVPGGAQDLGIWSSTEGVISAERYRAVWILPTG